MTLLEHMTNDEEFRVIVCGSRKETRIVYVRAWLDRLFCPIYDHDKQGRLGTWLPRPDLRLILGGATGADSIAEDWAVVNWVQHKVFPVTDEDWTKYGKSAGPRRNGIMLLELPHLVVAFPGGRGTKNMCSQAEEAGVAVLRIP